MYSSVLCIDYNIDHLYSCVTEDALRSSSYIPLSNELRNQGPLAGCILTGLGGKLADRLQFTTIGVLFPFPLFRGV